MRDSASRKPSSICRTTEQGGLKIGIGTMARITLTVSTKQDRPYVVIDDPIPAGFEIVNTSFLTSGNDLDPELNEGTGSSIIRR
jgi:uncharacterized protein YfaS (alpha-2-macroglobulin family)